MSENHKYSYTTLMMVLPITRMMVEERKVKVELRVQLLGMKLKLKVTGNRKSKRKAGLESCYYGSCMILMMNTTTIILYMTSSHCIGDDFSGKALYHSLNSRSFSSGLREISASCHNPFMRFE